MAGLVPAISFHGARLCHAYRDGRDIRAFTPVFDGLCPAMTVECVETPERKPGAFYGRRKGHPLRERQAALMGTLLPKLALDLSKPAPDNLRALFNGAGDVRLESG